MKNRKREYCPKCGRQEVVAKENELKMCSRCALIRSVIAGRKTTLTGMDILKARKKKRWSARKLVRELNYKISPSLLSKIEKGERQVNSILSAWYHKNVC